MVGKISNVLDEVFEERLGFDLRESRNAIMDKRGEAVLVVIIADLLVFPVLELLGVVEDGFQLLVDMGSGNRVDHGYIEVVGIIVAIIICDIGSQGLLVGVRVVFVPEGERGLINVVEERDFFADVSGANAAGGEKGCPYVDGLVVLADTKSTLLQEVACCRSFCCPHAQRFGRSGMFRAYRTKIISLNSCLLRVRPKWAAAVVVNVVFAPFWEFISISLRRILSFEFEGAALSSEIIAVRSFSISATIADLALALCLVWSDLLYAKPVLWEAQEDMSSTR